MARHPHPLLFLGSQQRLTFFTEAAPIAWEAKADEGVDLIDAGTSILTGAGDTVINVWRGEGGAESEVSLPSVPSPHRKPGRKWGHDPTIHPGPKYSSSGLYTNGSLPLEVKRVEPHMINIALIGADATGLAGGQGVQSIPPDSRTMKVLFLPTDPENVEAAGSFWNVEPRETGFQSICKDLQSHKAICSDKYPVELPLLPPLCRQCLRHV